jgi:hypothetical protein
MPEERPGFSAIPFLLLPGTMAMLVCSPPLIPPLPCHALRLNRRSSGQAIQRRYRKRGFSRRSSLRRSLERAVRARAADDLAQRVATNVSTDSSLPLPDSGEHR